MAAYDAATGDLVATIPVGARPIGILAPAGTSEVYVSDEDSDTVTVISNRDLAVVAKVPIGPKPHHMNDSPAGRAIVGEAAVGARLSGCGYSPGGCPRTPTR